MLGGVPARSIPKRLQSSEFGRGGGSAIRQPCRVGGEQGVWLNMIRIVSVFVLWGALLGGLQSLTSLPHWAEALGAGGAGLTLLIWGLSLRNSEEAAAQGRELIAEKEMHSSRSA